jgi:hypothetical protein
MTTVQRMSRPRPTTRRSNHHRERRLHEAQGPQRGSRGGGRRTSGHAGRRAGRKAGRTRGPRDSLCGPCVSVAWFGLCGCLLRAEELEVVGFSCSGVSPAHDDSGKSSSCPAELRRSWFLPFSIGVAGLEKVTTAASVTSGTAATRIGRRQTRWTLACTPHGWLFDTASA